MFRFSIRTEFVPLRGRPNIMPLSAMNRFIASLILLSCALPLGASEWSQWRGPNRNGVLTASTALAESWPEAGLPLVWESEPIPGNDDGGHGSVAIRGDRAYLSVVWHLDEPTETRAIDSLVLRKLGYRATKSLGAERVAGMETARESLSPRLRGSKLEAFAQEWVAANLDTKQQQLLGSWVVSRFKKGRLAIPITAFDKLETVSKRRFANQAELESWVDSQGFADHVRKEILEAVPPTRKVAKDVIVCLDLKTGRTLWKSEAAGLPTGRNSSSTPCVADGRVFGIGSTHIHCADAETGQALWSTPLKAKGPASSPLYLEGTVLYLDGRLVALDAATGKERWVQTEVSGSNTSPVAWTHQGIHYILCNSRKDLVAIRLDTGEVAWKTPGGGDSTPVVEGDRMAVFSRDPKLGLSAYTLSPEGARRMWSHPIDERRSQSTPILYRDHVYLLGAGMHLCVELETGKVAWKEKRQSTITSPVLADDKIYILENNGNNLVMLRADPTSHQPLGKANVRALWCPSPAVSTDGRVILRLPDRLQCFDLTQPGPAPSNAPR